MSNSQSKSSKGFYDHLIAWTRRGFAVIALGLAILVVLWPSLQDEEVSFTLSYEDTTPNSDQIRMVNLRYTGVDPEGRRFEIAADRGVQSSPEAPSVKLEGIRASIEMNNERSALLQSRSGTFFVEENLLAMEGGVVMTTSDGYRFTAGAARFNLESYHAYSDEQIAGSGPLGSFKADSFEIYVDQRLVIFEGHVQMRLYPLRNQGPDPNPGNRREKL